MGVVWDQPLRDDRRDRRDRPLDRQARLLASDPIDNGSEYVHHRLGRSAIVFRAVETPALTAPI